MRPAPALALALVLHAQVSSAHGRDPEVVTLEEGPDDTITVGVRVDDDPARVGERWSFALSARCRVLDVPMRVPEARGERWRWRVDCGPGRLDGVAVDSLGSAHETLVTVRRRDGTALVRALRPSSPAMVIPAARAAAAPWWSTARAFVAVGAAHLATGPDHLLLLALLLVRVRRARARLAAVTAFTLGHAATLGLAATTSLPLSAGWVEALIAGSVWLLAADTWRAFDARDPATPTAVPALFGLVHGLGFAAGLRAAGAGERVAALAGFNLGLELAQVGVVLAALAVERAAAGRAPWASRAITAAAGAAGAWWLVGRVAAMVTA